MGSLIMLHMCFSCAQPVSMSLCMVIGGRLDSSARAVTGVLLRQPVIT